MHKYATLNDTVYFWFALNTTSGSGGDGASHTFDVRLGGAATTAAPVYSGTPDLLTHANYPDGCLEVVIPATAGNGFAATNQYGVFCAAAISSVNPTGFIGGITLSPVVANLVQISGDAQSATDLKDFADAGYDPATNKVQGVVLVDTITTYTGNTLQTGDSFALIGTAGAGLTNINLPNQTMDITGNLIGNVTGNLGGDIVGDLLGVVGGMSAGALADFFVVDSGETYASAVPGSVVAEIADNAGGSGLTVQDIVDGVWDEPMASHLVSGSTGASLNGAGSAGDPWTTVLPGAYGVGTAGNIVGNFLDAAITDVLTAIGGLENPSVQDIVDGLMANVTEGSENFGQTMRLIRAILLGKVAVSGNDVLFYALDGTTLRVTSTTTAAGERTAVVVNDAD